MTDEQILASLWAHVYAEVIPGVSPHGSKPELAAAQMADQCLQALLERTSAPGGISGYLKQQRIDLQKRLDALK